MKVKLKEKNLVWIFLYHVLLITASQLIPGYTYKTLVGDTQKFIKNGVDSIEIVATNSLSTGG